VRQALKIALTFHRGFGVFALLLLFVSQACSPGFFIIATDSFDSPLSHGWGSSEQGAAYRLIGPESAFSVSGGVGWMTFESAGLPRGAYLDDVGAGDVDLKIRVRTDPAPSGGREFVFLALRHHDAGEYIAKFSFSPESTVYGQIARVDTASGAEIPLTQDIQLTNTLYGPGTWFVLELQTIGSYPTTLSARIWPDGSASGAWSLAAVDATDALQAPGGAGIRGYVSSRASVVPVVFGFDDFRVGG
jgi:large repetitive protein